MSGPKRFRANACLALATEELVVTDGKGRVHRFPLETTEGGPAWFCTFPGPCSRRGFEVFEHAFADAHHEALVRLYATQWRTDELQGIVKAAGLIVTDALYDAPKVDRAECVDLRVVGRPLRLVIAAVEIMVAVVLVVWAVKAVTGS